MGADGQLQEVGGAGAGSAGGDGGGPLPVLLGCFPTAADQASLAFATANRSAANFRGELDFVLLPGLENDADGGCVGVGLPGTPPSVPARSLHLVRGDGVPVPPFDGRLDTAEVYCGVHFETHQPTQF